MRALGQTQTGSRALQHIATLAAHSPQRAARDARGSRSARAWVTWMLRQDLLGYILLGDPAVRLPVRPAPASPPSAPATPLSWPHPSACLAAVTSWIARDLAPPDATPTHRCPPPTSSAWSPQSAPSSPAAGMWQPWPPSLAYRPLSSSTMSNAIVAPAALLGPPDPSGNQNRSEEPRPRRSERPPGRDRRLTQRQGSAVGFDWRSAASFPRSERPRPRPVTKLR